MERLYCLPSVGRRCTPRMRTTAVALGACAIVSAPVHAQDGPVYVGGSLLLVSTSAPTDEPGSGYLRPNFHGSLQWPVAGIGVHSGVFVSPHWDVRVESLNRTT
jgi:hypothetical protein